MPRHKPSPELGRPAERRARCDFLRIPTYEEVEGTEVEDKFRRLVAQCRARHSVTPFLSDVTMSGPYQMIIGMGPPAVPLMLVELERKPEAWFWALAAITGEDPLSDEDRGKSREMAAAWLDWGRKHGIIP